MGLPHFKQNFFSAKRPTPAFIRPPFNFLSQMSHLIICICELYQKISFSQIFVRIAYKWGLFVIHSQACNLLGGGKMSHYNLVYKI